MVRTNRTQFALMLANDVERSAELLSVVELSVDVSAVFKTASTK